MIDSLINVSLMIFFGVCFLFLIVLLSRAMYMIRQAEVVIIERLGKYERTLEPG
jgi:regulator of protease activity HflC (stomatin/prohibitin superfamily)